VHSIVPGSLEEHGADQVRQFRTHPISETGPDIGKRMRGVEFREGNQDYVIIKRGGLAIVYAA